MNTRLCVLLTVLVAVIAGCDTSADPGVPNSGGGVYILNEGAFQMGNAELSFYDPATGSVSGNLYSQSNSGATLGDVATDMSFFDGRLYVVVNNSGRIDILDPSTHVSIGRIAVPGLPRSIVIVDAEKAYVTMQDSTVAIVNPRTMSFLRSIVVGLFPEDIVRSGDHVFAMNGGFGWGSTISVIDIITDKVVATISTPNGPSYAAVGPNGGVLVVCTGGTDYLNPANDTHGAILNISPSTFQIVDSIGVVGHPGKMVVRQDGMMFLLGPGEYPSTPVWEVSTSPSMTVVSNELIAGAFYGIGLHTGREEIYLADAGNFTTNGKVYVYGYDGTQKVVLSTGIGVAPNSFLVAEQ